MNIIFSTLKGFSKIKNVEDQHVSLHTSKRLYHSSFLFKICDSIEMICIEIISHKQGKDGLQ